MAKVWLYDAAGRTPQLRAQVLDPPPEMVTHDGRLWIWRPALRRYCETTAPYYAHLTEQQEEFVMSNDPQNPDPQLGDLKEVLAAGGPSGPRGAIPWAVILEAVGAIVDYFRNRPRSAAAGHEHHDLEASSCEVVCACAEALHKALHHHQECCAGGH